MADEEEPPVDDRALPPPPPEARDKQIAAGYEHTAIIDERGRVFTFGSNRYGQLGHRERRSHQRPRLVAALAGDRIAQVALGSYHTIFLDTEGRAYACGCNSNGQLGLGDCNNRRAPALVAALAGVRIVQVSAGRQHTFFLSSEGRVYACGVDYSMMLNCGDYEDYATPTLVDAIADKTIVQVASGTMHVAFLSADGRVFTCGTNNFGQLGLGDMSTRRVPTLVADLKDIVQISSGDKHTVFLDRTGRVYGCGHNYVGQLGLGNKDIRYSPVPVLTPLPVCAAQVSAGAAHTLILSDSGKVHVCGMYEHWGLVKDTPLDEVYAGVIVLPSAVASVSAGYYHSVLLARDGGVYTAGDGSFGKLGRGAPPGFVPLGKVDGY